MKKAKSTATKAQTKPKKRTPKVKLPPKLATKVRDALKEARDYVKENRKHFKSGL
jgi:hypothetical protein